MTVREGLWEKDQAEKYSRWTKLGSRFVYAPFARKIIKHLPSLERDSTIVDLGTGPGLLAIELSKLLPEARIIGIDPSGELLKIAKKNADEAGISAYETRLGTAEEIPIASGSVGLVVTQSSLHEWDNPRNGLSEVFRILKPGGSLILKDYNRNWLSKWKSKLLGRFHHLDMFKFTFDEVVDLLKQAGFDEIKGEEGGVQFLVQGLRRESVDPDQEDVPH